MNAAFIVGGIYKLRHQGMCEFLGTDCYYGQWTLKFRRLEHGDTRYMLPTDPDLNAASETVSADSAPAVTCDHFPGQTVCEWCKGTGAIDAPTSADDPSCPDCDGEGTLAK